LIAGASSPRPELSELAAVELQQMIRSLAEDARERDTARMDRVRSSVLAHVIADKPQS
jgi:hypothetical protein